jgi:hypothetical protein
MRLGLPFLLALALFVTACSGSPPVGTDGGGGGFDGGTMRDGGPFPTDGSLRIDGSLRTDGGMMTGCASGMHMCPSGCEPDRENDPERGCRLGCGTDVCEPPEGGDAMCDAAGMCVTSCPMGDPMDGVCCGGDLMCSSGISTLLACPSPSEEPNETSVAARRLGGYNDEDGNMESVTGIALPVSDVDYFSFGVSDTCCSVSTSSIVRVTLSTPVSGAVELGAWFKCLTADDSHTCTGGTGDSTHPGVGCTGPAVGATGTATITLEFDLDCDFTTSEDGTMLVRVRPAPGATECAEYDLSFHVTT